MTSTDGRLRREHQVNACRPRLLSDPRDQLFNFLPTIIIMSANSSMTTTMLAVLSMPALTAPHPSIPALDRGSKEDLRSACLLSQRL